MTDFVLPSAPAPEATETDAKMVTTTLDPELNEAFSAICGDRARSGVLRYMIAVCCESAGQDINPAVYSKISAGRTPKDEEGPDDE